MPKKKQENNLETATASSGAAVQTAVEKPAARKTKNVIEKPACCCANVLHLNPCQKA